MRIISGKHKGRRIELAKDLGDVRPTSDFAREAIFNILTHGKHGANGESFIGKSVLDLCCGTGAFGLEALSRGAAHVTFVDNARQSIATARFNALKFGEGDHCDFIAADATRLGKSRRRYALVFVDPPYFSKLLAPALKSLKEGGWLENDAIVIIEHDAKELIELPDTFESIDQRKYGRAMVELIRLK